jgi:hypothetical protein
MTSNKSAFSLARVWKPAAILRFVSQESLRLGTMAFTLAVKMMDLMSPTTFVGQSSTTQKAPLKRAESSGLD